MTQPAYGPYTPIVRAGDYYYVSGQIGVSTSTKTAPDNIAEQAAQTLHNLRSVLEAAGLTMNDVVKTTVFLTDMGHFGEFNEVYMQYFEAPRPARSCIAVRELPRVGGGTDLLVEIEAVAYRQGKDNA